MSDTGGGHRASSKALVNALERLYPGKIDAEIVKIGRIQGFRQWIIAQSIVAIGSVGIGLTTFVARLVFVQIYPESSA